jgi:GT2 family glycosyltransferase
MKDDGYRLRISVVIVTLRRPEPLHRTLESIRACRPSADEVIVVDADPEAAPLEASAGEEGAGPLIRHVRTSARLTRQRNIGIDEASGEVVVFLDDDVKVPNDLFGRLAETYSDAAVVGVTGRVEEPETTRRGGPGSRVRRLLLSDGSGRFTRYGYPRYVTDGAGPRDVEFMPGCFMSARREAAAKVRFDERLGAYALAEDEDFSYRLSRLGRIVYLPDVVVVHEKLGFRSFDSRKFGRLVVRNRTYLFRKNFPQTRLARLQFGGLLLMLVGHRLVNREWRGALGVLEGAARVVRGKS